MRKTSEKLQCKCILTDEETLKYSRDMSSAKSKQSRFESELKSYTITKKAEIQEQETKVLIFSEKINNGYEFRDVECEIVYDFDIKIKRWYRKDTGEVEKEDIISDRELQEELL